MSAILSVVVLASVGATGGDSRSSSVRVVRDSFVQLRPSAWTLSTLGTGPEARAVEGRLELSFPPASDGQTFMARVENRTLVRGDFDVRVDYRLVEWPPSNGVKISLGTTEGSVQRVSDPQQGGEVYLTHFEGAGVGGNTPTADYSGKLRLVRRGNLLTGYTYRAGAWVPVRSAPLPSRTPVRLHLAAWSHRDVFGNRPVRVAFDNFVLRIPERRRPARKR